MPRKPVISRTMTAQQVVALRTDVKREKVRHETFLLVGSFPDKEAILKKCRELYDDEDLVTSRIKSVKEVKVFAAMSPQKFIDAADDINLL